MKEHELWGRKTPGPYTQAANGFFDSLENGAGKANGAGASVLGGVGAGVAHTSSALGSAGNNALDGIYGRATTRDGEIDNPPDHYPWTRDGEISGENR